MRLVLETLSLVALVAMFLMLSVYWPDLPEKIPRHFNFAGKPDAWGGKGSLYVLPVAGLAAYALLTIVPRFPRKMNYPFALTAENRERQTALALGMLLWMKAEIMLLFAYMEWMTCETALGRADGFGVWLLPLSMTIVMGTIAAYLLLAWRVR
jgi:uncharacterized membrane protein